MDQPSGSRKRPISQTDKPIMDHSCPQKRPLEMTLELVADNLHDATHVRLDKLVLGILDDEPYSGLLGLLLLTTIVHNSEGKLDSRYSNPSQAKALLREHPALTDALEKAWGQKSFKDIRNLSMLCVILPCRISSNVDTEILRPKQGLCYCCPTRTHTHEFLSLATSTSMIQGHERELLLLFRCQRILSVKSNSGM
jgi:hypothetical protein